MFVCVLARASEATCKSQILTAKAVVKDVGEATASRCGISLWAGCHLSNSERDTHKVIEKQKSKLDIPISRMQIKQESLPWIDPRDWLKWILRKGLWPMLSGAPRNNYRLAGDLWTEFWRRVQILQPHFALFEMDGIDLSTTACFLIHGDEGRSLKRQGIMITSLQSAIGCGFDQKRYARAVTENDIPLKVNYTGHSFTHRFITSTIPKSVYEDDPEMFHLAMDQLAISLQSLLVDGIVDAVTKKTYRIAILACKGDAPYLAKLGRFYRSHSTGIKRGEEKRPPKGVCHRCLAGTNGFPAEELTSWSPAWVMTRGIRNPWLRTPCVIERLVHDVSDPSSFFQSDIWHIVHLGFGRSWVASVVQVLLEVVPGTNLDAKWKYLTQDYQRWCRLHRKQCHISSITPYLMSYNDRTGAMGNWHKGSLTTNFFGWLTALISSLPEDQAQLLGRCKQATTCMNQIFSCLFKADAFLSAEQSMYVSNRGLAFLQTYTAMANRMYSLGKPWLFALYPKLHAYHEIMLTLRQQAQDCGMSYNPIMFCCQMDEDIVGRASRLSRRVNLRRVMDRTLGRYLISCHTAFVCAGFLS